MKWIKNHVYACKWGHCNNIFIDVLKEYTQTEIIIDCIYPKEYKGNNLLIGISTLELEDNYIIDLGPYITMEDLQSTLYEI